ncbi:hypothetical protein [Polaromonas sp.]|uniref:hypothetical protein n=1 Tax=Polaromonas sp. TaxID=1869339 RepID=UPI003267D043
MPSQKQLDAFTEAFHRAAIRRLAMEPELVERASHTLQRWQEQRGSTASDPYLQEWRVLLSGDLNVLQERVCADNDLAATLRNVSPLGFVLTPAERQALRAQSVV